MRRINLVVLLLIAAAMVFSSCQRKELSTHEPVRSTEEGEILHWTCGMHPSVRAEGPGKCPICNMDLVPVYRKQGSEEEGDLVRLTLGARARELASVRTSRVDYLPLEREIRTVGRIEWDERRLAHISSRVAGRIDKMFVDFTGKKVKQGEPLVWIYSPDLVMAQQEYLVAMETLEKIEKSPIEEAVRSARSLVQSARNRLLLWGITDEQIDGLAKRGVSETHLTIYSPHAGTVIEKTAEEGKYVKEGEMIYRIGDLSNLWMLADVYEDEIPHIKVGQRVEMSASSFPDDVFEGMITFIDPYVDDRTRSVKVRAQMANSGEKLRPGMWVDAVVRTSVSDRIDPYYTCPMHPDVVSRESGECPKCGMFLKKVDANLVLAVPKSAVLDVGTRKLVYVARGEGGYEAREVRLGPEAGVRMEGTRDRLFPVLDGLAEGDEVVTQANFLIDSQAQLTGEAAGVYGGSIEVEELQQ